MISVFVELAGAPQRLDDAADALVHAVDLRGVDLHAAQQPRLVLGLRPRRLRRVAVGELPRLVQDAPLDELVEALRAQRVPALVEAALVLRDVLVVRVQRPVRRGVGDVVEERRPGGLALVLLDVGDGLVADRVGVEEGVVGLRLVLDVLVAARERIGIVEAARADDGAEELVEAALQRPGVGGFGQAARDVPLAAHVRLVAVALERLRDGDAALVQVAGVALGTRVVGEDADAGLVRVQAGQHRRPRRAAARGVVELREAQPVGGEAVEVRRLDLAAVAADVGVAHVVVEDQHDIRFGRLGHVGSVVVAGSGDGVRAARRFAGRTGAPPRGRSRGTRRRLRAPPAGGRSSASAGARRRRS